MRNPRPRSNPGRADGVNRRRGGRRAVPGGGPCGAFRNWPPPCLRRGCPLWLRWRMTGTGTRRSSCGRGCGSAPPRPGAGWRWPPSCCPGRHSPAGPCRPCTRSSAPPSRPARSPPGPRPLITLALDRVRHSCLPEAVAAMEHALTRTAAENDADFLARVARRWTEALDQDGAEPSEELLRQLQGAFLRKPRHGLQHLEIFATTDQFEHLVTVMNTATNPRTGQAATPAKAPPPATRRRPDRATGPGRASVGRRTAGRRRSPPRRRGPVAAVPGPPLPAAEAARRPGRRAAKPPSPPEGCPPRAGSGPRSWPPSTTGTCSPGSGRLRPKQAPLPTPHSTAPEPGTAPGRCCSPAPSPLHRPQNRLRRRHHPGRPRRRGPGPGHRPRLPDLPAPHPQGHHGPGPGLRLPAMHHPRPLVRGPPHHLLVPRRNHRNRQRHPALLPSPPPDPQGTLDHPDAHRHPLVHPATPPRPRPDAPPEHLLPPRVTLRLPPRMT